MMENYYKIGRKLMNLHSEVNNTTNSSDVKYLDKVRVDVNALLPAYLIILVACVIGNSLVCLTVIKNPDMKRKRWYYFLMNLSVADMGFALATPVHVLQFSRVDMGDIGCKLGVHIIDTFMITSIMTLAYISIDRYICICFPKVGYTKRANPILIIAAIWMLAILFLSPFSIYCRKSNFAGNSCDCRYAWPSPTHYRFYKFLLAAIWFLIPFTTMIFCYTKIVLQLWGRKGESNSIDNDRSGKKKRSIKMMILATSLFFFSWFPYTMLYLLKEMKVGNPRVVGKFWLLIQLIAFANSAWNPFTYCIFSTDFRKGFKKIFFWKKAFGEARIQEARRQQSDMEQNCISSKSDNSAKKTESEGL